VEFARKLNKWINLISNENLGRRKGEKNGEKRFFIQIYSLYFSASSAAKVFFEVDIRTESA